METAEEFLKRDESGVYNEVDITQAMIEFAKMHVKAAIKTAAENAAAYVSTDDEPTVSKGSIFSAYRLSNIK